MKLKILDQEVIELKEYRDYMEFVDRCIEQDFDVFQIVGGLIDDYLIYTNNDILGYYKGNILKPKYIILKSKPINCYQSKYTLILTNNDSLAQDYYSRWEKQVYQDDEDLY